MKALALVARHNYAAVYVDAEYFADVTNVGQLLQNDRILRSMADGVVMLDRENTVMWFNDSFEAWCKDGQQVIGGNFYRVLGGPEILGPDFCPFHSAFATGACSVSTLRTEDNRYFKIHATPVSKNGPIEDVATKDGFSSRPAKSEPAKTEHLIVTVHDVSDEVLQQQKLAAIHQAGTDLADLLPDEVATLDYTERVDLLKENILHCMQDVLQLDVIEIRMLDQQTRKLEPVMAVGMAPVAVERELLADSSGNGVTGFVASTGKSYLCGHTTEDPLYLEGAEGARSSLTVPLMLHDVVIGTLNVESPESNAFTESDLQFLEIFARSVAAAINTLDLLAAEKASTAAASVEAIHSAVALPIDIILNDAVNVMESYIGHDEPVLERLHRILQNARDIKMMIHEVGQSMAPVTAQVGPDTDEKRPILAGKRILVVDDDDSVRAAAHELLDRYHCVLETAHNGNEATYMVRNLSENERYDIILADIRLPDMSGYDLFMKLKEFLDPVPLVLMTGFGYDPGHSIVKARREGVRSVLYKPFRLDQLISTIEDNLQAFQA
ncbi:hybrid sensor histidine kinase/response regulator [Adhaeretor mobilis]|uniref:hybrid sensor histidine kinase/response regulator n=1 Tax=Adhaeretor mobilis TaxID=1930276 RepID=UPI001FEB46A4|nr:response regulator [Adhaeretor mobilis]